MRLPLGLPFTQRPTVISRANPRLQQDPIGSLRSVMEIPGETPLEN